MACPKCSYANDASFRFCQLCGYSRKVLLPWAPEDLLDIDLDAINARFVSLFASESKYDKQKSQLEKLLIQFLASLPASKDLYSATPSDVVSFLIWKDSKGKTQIHNSNCPNVGLRGHPPCVCPVRLAAGTVDSLIGKLRAIFKEAGRTQDWEENLCLGNPAASLLVKRYLKLVKEEQAMAGVTPKQAVPMFTDKLVRLADHIDSKLRDTSNDATTIYILARDQAFFKALLFSGDRPGDLSQVKTQEILRFPNDDGLLFNHTWGKTLRGGSSNLFGIKRCQNTKICAVAAIERYISISRGLRIDLSEGFLFRPTSKSGGIINTPISSEAMGNRLNTYLKELGIHEGETAHSFRSGSAITLALTGASLADIMSHVGWGREHTARYYMQLAKVLQFDSVSSRLADAVDSHQTTAELTRLYQDLNRLKDFATAFPPVESLKRKNEDSP